MKKIIAAFVFILDISIGHSQYINTSYKEALEIKKRTLLVVLPENDKYLLSMYGQDKDSAEYVQLYINDMEGQRLALKNAISEHWKFTDNTIITSLKEAKSLIKKFPDKYALLRIGEQFQDRTYITFKTSSPPITSWNLANGEFVYNASNRYNIRRLGITSLDIEMPKRIFRVYLPKMSSSLGDFIYAVRQIDYVLTSILKSEENSANKLYRNIILVSEELKNKTLLIDVKETNCTEEAIKKVYPYPFRIVSYDAIEDVLKTKDDNYAIIQTARFDTQSSTHYVANAGNGTIYCNFNSPTFNYSGGENAYIRVYYPLITVKEFEKYKD